MQGDDISTKVAPLQTADPAECIQSMTVLRDLNLRLTKVILLLIFKWMVTY